MTALRDEESYDDILTPSFEGVFFVNILLAYGQNLYKTIDLYIRGGLYYDKKTFHI
jgi:hypothetical protein